MVLRPGAVLHDIGHGKGEGRSRDIRGFPGDSVLLGCLCDPSCDENIDRKEWLSNGLYLCHQWVVLKVMWPYTKHTVFRDAAMRHKISNFSQMLFASCYSFQSWRSAISSQSDSCFPLLLSPWFWPLGSFRVSYPDFASKSFRTPSLFFPFRLFFFKFCFVLNSVMAFGQ